MKGVKTNDSQDDGQDDGQTPEYPLSAPIKPNDPERKSDASREETRDWSEDSDRKP